MFGIIQQYRNCEETTNHIMNIDFSAESDALVKAGFERFCSKLSDSMFDQLKNAEDFTGVYAVIARRVPDARGIMLTALPGADSEAAFYASVLGVDPRLAVAMAHDDVLLGATIGKYLPDHDPKNHIHLGTVISISDPTSSYAVFVRDDVKNYVPQFYPDECLLIGTKSDAYFIMPDTLLIESAQSHYEIDTYSPLYLWDESAAEAFGQALDEAIDNKFKTRAGSKTTVIDRRREPKARDVTDKTASKSGIVRFL